MAPYTNIPLSPAELSYLHKSLSQSPPIRPDGRSQTDFRPLTAESEILPAANGSARICFADGAEAIVGIKAEIEKSRNTALYRTGLEQEQNNEDEQTHSRRGEDEWLEIAIDVPGLRDDDALPIFLSAMLSEALLADGTLQDRLYINNRFHWRLYIDVLLLSQPLAYPLPLLSLTTHLALLNTRLPALLSQGDEDPLFNDDWDASKSLYPRTSKSQPPITLLVMSIGGNAFYDPSRDELAVADAVLAVSVTQSQFDGTLRVVSTRTVDPPSRLTAGGIPRDLGAASGGTASISHAEALLKREKDEGATVWRPPRGGLKRALLTQVLTSVVKDGVINDVLEALSNVKG